MPTAETTEPPVPPRQKLQEKWLGALLPLAGERGWSDSVLAEAAAIAGIDEADQALAAPDGADSLVEAFLARGDRAMLAAIEDADLPTMRVRDRVAMCVMAWLDALSDHKPAFRRALGRGLMPFKVPKATERTWMLADAVWTGIGDTSTDYNKYTKRGLLASILPPVTLYWLNEDDPEKVRAFLDRRLDTVMRVGGTFGKVLKRFTG